MKNHYGNPETRKLRTGRRQSDKPKGAPKIENCAALGDPSWRPYRWLAEDGRHHRRDKRCYPTTLFVRTPETKRHFLSLDTIAEMPALLWQTLQSRQDGIGPRCVIGDSSTAH